MNDRGRVEREFTVWCGTCADWERALGPAQSDAERAWLHRGRTNTRKHGRRCPRCSGSAKPKSDLLIDILAEPKS